MGSNYKFGRRYEYRERDYQRRQGFFSDRSHGSKGPWDVYSTDGSVVRFIQVKAYRDGSRRPSIKQDIRRLKKIPSGPAVERYIVIYGPTKSGVKTPREEILLEE